MITASRPLHTGRLVLAPVDALVGVEAEPLADVLRDIGLIGAPLPERSAAFATGARFLELIAFTGCAVQVELAPASAGGTFAHIRLQGPYPRPRLQSGRNTRPPRCPECGKALATWRAQAQAWQGARMPNLRCEVCSADTPAWRWGWRQHAGFGRSFVCIEEVFPGEGAPLPSLLEGLETLGIGAWHHFYVQD
jgi:hypothetical protein